MAENREAGVLFEHAQIAAYFKGIFETDWKDGIGKLPTFGKSQVATPQAVQSGGFVRVIPADYAEV